MIPRRALQIALAQLAGGALNERDPPMPATYGGMAALWGGSHPEMAAEISGTNDKKSKAYKAARRDLERYRRGERQPWETGRPSKTFDRLRDLARRRWQKITPTRLDRTLDKIRGRGVVADFAGTITVSDDTRIRTFNNVYVPPRLLANAPDGNFFALAHSRQWDGATDTFNQALFTAYGIGPFVEVNEVDFLGLRYG